MSNSSGFDVDLLEGQAHEDALARLLCRARFEHKYDKAWAECGNHFLEVSQRGGRSSGIDVTRADWWVIEYYADCRLILPTRYVRATRRLAEELGRPLVQRGDNDNRGYLVPLAWFTEPAVLLSTLRDFPEGE